MLFDGFRNDYLDRGITPTLTNFRDNGVHSDYLKTVYPASQMSVMITISRGFYPESHGIILSAADYYQHSDLNRIGGRKLVASGSPIPISELNQKNGGITGCMLWNHCVGTHNHEYVKNSYVPLRKRADEVIGWLNVTDTSKRPNLVMVYVEELDRITHFFGPLSRNSSLFIKRLDLFTKYIIDKLIEIDVYHMTTIIILSDHGMREIDPDIDEIPQGQEKTRIQNNALSSTIVTNDVNGAHLMKIDKNNLQQYKTYIDQVANDSRDTGYFDIIRVPPGIKKDGEEIIMEYAACPGWVFSLDKWKIGEFGKYRSRFPAPLEGPKYDWTPKGVHGYVRQNDAMFMAKGPMLARFKKVEPFEMVDLYCAFAKLLDIKGNFERQGNYSRIMPIFTTHEPVNWISTIIIIVPLAVVATLLFHKFVEYLLHTPAATR